MPSDIERETAGQSPSSVIPPTRIHSVFTWPAAGAMQITSLAGGGCNIKIKFSEGGTVRSIGPGQIVKVRNIPTKRIAQQYEILIRHADDFESSYSIVDQTPNLPAGRSRPLRAPGALVEDGEELYIIGNGGFLHFQLSRAGRLVDPREYIHIELDGGP